MAIEDGAVPVNPVCGSSTRASVGMQSSHAPTPEQASTFTGGCECGGAGALESTPSVILDVHFGRYVVSAAAADELDR